MQLQTTQGLWYWDLSLAFIQLSAPDELDVGLWKAHRHRISTKAAPFGFPLTDARTIYDHEDLIGSVLRASTPCHHLDSESLLRKLPHSTAFAGRVCIPVCCRTVGVPADERNTLGAPRSSIRAIDQSACRNLGTGSASMHLLKFVAVVMDTPLSSPRHSDFALVSV